ncbi:hypothetical protein ASAP_1660 [Asaia bogorensis]|uniref:Uncharacterized protein n=1 Tax=Asaia bogorensis TaxID=91915 RepID=A0A060QFN4_9PROT|nr:hypothetical protein ASAP_1660 [Asaia bogorensis]
MSVGKWPALKNDLSKVVPEWQHARRRKPPSPQGIRAALGPEFDHDACEASASIDTALN